MSRRSSTIVEDLNFIRRFAEVCGTTKPAEVARLLDISYQAAKNYLSGRIPNPYVLRSISEITSYSIHWILTGEGEKFTGEQKSKLSDEARNFVSSSCAEHITDENREFVCNVCREILSCISDEQNDGEREKEKVFILTADKIKREKDPEISREILEKEI